MKTAKEVIKLFVPPIITAAYRKIKPVKNAMGEGYTIKDIQSLYLQEVNCRKQLNFTQIGMLAKDIPSNFFCSICTDFDEPNYYGGFYELAKYMNIYPLYCPRGVTILHGVIFKGGIWERDGIEKYLVWGSGIKDYYSSEYNIVAIGAPFFYAKSLLSKDEIFSEKKRLGKNLLAFPSHSTHWIEAEFDEKIFIDVLKKEQKKFDSVRVCLYWKDILLGKEKPYLDAGFECVCAGHIFDMFFLERLKSLFEISDCTISNQIGSHVGYSIFMNKPYNLVLQAKSEKYDDVPWNKGEDKKLNEQRSSEAYKKTVALFLNNFDYKINDEQRSIVDDYWGISQKKSSKELYDIIYGSE